MQKLVALFFCLFVGTTSAYDFTWKEDVALTGATYLMLKNARNFHFTCTEDPCNAINHFALGSVAGLYMKKRHGWKAGLATGIVLGVGKELMDKRFDKKDALMTIFGSVLVVSYEF